MSLCPNVCDLSFGPLVKVVLASVTYCRVTSF